MKRKKGAWQQTRTRRQIKSYTAARFAFNKPTFTRRFAKYSRSSSSVGVLVVVVDDEETRVIRDFKLTRDVRVLPFVTSRVVLLRSSKSFQPSPAFLPPHRRHHRPRRPCLRHLNPLAGCQHGTEQGLDTQRQCHYHRCSLGPGCKSSTSLLCGQCC